MTNEREPVFELPIDRERDLGSLEVFTNGDNIAVRMRNQRGQTVKTAYLTRADATNLGINLIRSAGLIPDSKKSEGKG